MRLAKSRITDHRPNGQAGTPPLERNARPGAVARPNPGLTQWNKTEATMQTEHDRNVSIYTPSTAKTALQDLATRRTTGHDPESRWIRHRRAALIRLLHAPKLIRRP